MEYESFFFHFLFFWLLWCFYYCPIYWCFGLQCSLVIGPLMISFLSFLILINLILCSLTSNYWYCFRIIHCLLHWLFLFIDFLDPIYQATMASKTLVIVHQQINCIVHPYYYLNYTLENLSYNKLPSCLVIYFSSFRSCSFWPFFVNHQDLFKLFFKTKILFWIFWAIVNGFYSFKINLYNFKVYLLYKVI